MKKMDIFDIALTDGVMNMHNVPRWIKDGEQVGMLYGFDWDNDQVVYRFVNNGNAEYHKYNMKEGGTNNVV